MIQSIGICEQAFDVMELMTAEVNAIQLTTLSLHAAKCCSSNTLRIDTKGAVRPSYLQLEV